MLNDNPRDDFAILFLTHGRAATMCTVETVKRCGYTGRWFIVIDDEDEINELELILTYIKATDKNAQIFCSTYGVSVF